ncbi:HD domain-containing protein [Barrientosiimonas marina]|uniref:DUF1871 family protein n=1 Tax=Lentibacillus kimchii TaxID=1542911 RepID=A0ABW2UY92_9BACI
MINKAIQFATVCHGNQKRKGTDIPYILHCLEAGTIAANMTNKDGRIDSDVVSAAILHDTAEDAYVTYETLKETFNPNIANLVQYQSEDKSKKWMDRKQDTIKFLKRNNSQDVEVATLADKLSNMKAISRDYEVDKDRLWDKFNAGKEQQHWYYKSIAEVLHQVKDTDEYKEYTELIQKVFETSFKV